jgi:SAM-dependent methyltransferase
MVKLASEIDKAGKALDIGCGDGKNLVYLENKGWIVDGIDISELAIQGAYERLRLNNQTNKGLIICQDVRDINYGIEEYDLIISYGLYHCLNDTDLLKVHNIAINALKTGGLFSFAIFNNHLPLPDNHHTNSIFLRDANYMLLHLSGFECINYFTGVIEEHHLPIVDKHKHSLTWGLFRKK